MTDCRFNNIEAERARHWMTRKALAKAIGVSENTYRNWQSGRCDMPVSSALKLAEVLKVPIDYLLQQKGGYQNAEGEPGEDT